MRHRGSLDSAFSYAVAFSDFFDTAVDDLLQVALLAQRRLELREGRVLNLLGASIQGCRLKLPEVQLVRCYRIPSGLIQIR